MAKTVTQSYPPQVCRRLDKLYAQRLFEKNRESDLKQERKALKSELAELGAGETQEHKEAGWAYSRVLFRLEHCRDRQKDLANRIDDTIKKAHEPGLFGDDEEDLDKPVEDQDVFKSIAKKLGAGDDGDEEDDADQQSLPVGGPSATQPPKPLKLTEPEIPEGLDEHLKASVNELDMREDLKGLLIAAGFDTIAKLVHVLDGPGGRSDLSTKANLSENKTATVAKAVGAYRKEHRSAMRSVETGT
ncbi:MAG TPA: hypothetical protein VK176_11670 [Phycisphaerales bacterium]|nr:hypothetical protein [Phycisphaerales bacterium]